MGICSHLESEDRNPEIVSRYDRDTHLYAELHIKLIFIIVTRSRLDLRWLEYRKGS